MSLNKTVNSTRLRFFSDAARRAKKEIATMGVTTDPPQTTAATVSNRILGPGSFSHIGTTIQTTTTYFNRTVSSATQQEARLDTLQNIIYTIAPDPIFAKWPIGTMKTNKKPPR